MVRVTGRIEARAKIMGVVGEDMVREVSKAVFAGADLIKVRAQHSITEGAISGKGHVPSRPGEPPKADTHALDRQIESELIGPLKALAASRDPKSRHLEDGTSRMAARPFMWPAAARSRAEIVKLVRDAVSRVVKRAK